ncbi:hypothetical protein B296_00017268 [Ensete ventricosum]|uniref:Uncharacterized protein n=1 Tax=Ensete ventricosum TaxID=4639 RepID=A0A426ZRB3_ENSVE|nr:hypothetical protein B296_00017268 [Ensete ventricosum]
MKVTISVLVLGSSLTITGSVIMPRGEMESLVNPINVDVNRVKSFVCDVHRDDQGLVVVQVLFSFRLETDLQVVVASRPLLDHSPGIGLAC